MRVESVVDKDGKELLNRITPFEAKLFGKTVAIQPITLMFCMWCGSQSLRLRDDHEVLEVHPSCTKPFVGGSPTVKWPTMPWEVKEGAK